MEFPRFVFISPGKTVTKEGSYDAEITTDQKDYDAALSAGYSPTVLEAFMRAEKPKIIVAEKTDPIQEQAKPEEPRPRGRPRSSAKEEE